MSEIQALTVTTDKTDYASEETALITASGLDAAGTVAFQLAHVADPDGRE